MPRKTEMSLSPLITDSWKQNRKIRFVIWAFVWPLATWVAIWPYPYHLAVGVAFSFTPLLLLLVGLLGRERFQLLGTVGLTGARIELSLPLMVVIAASAWRSICDFRSSNYSENTLPELAWIIPTSLLMSLLMRVSIRKTSFYAALFFSFLYVFPIIEYANTLGPTDSKKSFKGVISRKYPSYKLSGDSIVVRINNEEKHVKVSRKRYEQFEIGDFACVEEEKGWLGIVIRWSSPCAGLPDRPLDYSKTIASRDARGGVEKLDGVNEAPGSAVSPLNRLILCDLTHSFGALCSDIPRAPLGSE